MFKCFETVLSYIKQLLYKRRVLLHSNLLGLVLKFLLANIQQKNVQFCVIEIYRPVISLVFELVSAACYQQNVLFIVLHKLLKLHQKKGWEERVLKKKCTCVTSVAGLILLCFSKLVYCLLNN